jgi:DNA-binding MarR family transcriptional regulator
MAETLLPKDSPEYAKILSEVFAEVIRRSPLGSSASDEEITPSLLQALEYVYLHGPSPVRKIAEGLSISVSAASQLVDRLVRKGLTTRGEMANDRRQAAVDLTEHGRSLICEARQEKTDWIESILTGMSVEQRQALVASLEDFIRLALSSEDDIESACVRCGIEHLAFCILNRAHVAATGEQIRDY